MRALFHDIGLLLRLRPLRRAMLGYGAVIALFLAIAFTLIPPLQIAFYLGLGILLFLPVEYLTHRYALHSRAYLDSRVLARLWIRAHYAHHRIPDREDVILASPFSLVILIAGTTAPFFLVLDFYMIVVGIPAVLIPFAFCYEPVHFAAHTKAGFRSRYFGNRRRLHLLHHFHNEQRNYGICASVFDRVFGTHAERAGDAPRSPTVMNLGYDAALEKAKPLVRIEYERSLDRR